MAYAKIVHDESRIQVSLGGIRVFEERDRRYDRETPPGRTGLVAAGNAEVWFDDLRISRTAIASGDNRHRRRRRFRRHTV